MLVGKNKASARRGRRPQALAFCEALEQRRLLSSAGGLGGPLIEPKAIDMTAAPPAATASPAATVRIICSAPSVEAGQPVAISATVVASDHATLAGTVAFIRPDEQGPHSLADANGAVLMRGYLLGTVPLTADGEATLTVSTNNPDVSTGFFATGLFLTGGTVTSASSAARPSSLDAGCYSVVAAYLGSDVQLRGPEPAPETQATFPATSLPCISPDLISLTSGGTQAPPSAYSATSDSTQTLSDAYAAWLRFVANQPAFSTGLTGLQLVLVNHPSDGTIAILLPEPQVQTGAGAAPASGPAPLNVVADNPPGALSAPADFQVTYDGSTTIALSMLNQPTKTYAPTFVATLSSAQRGLFGTVPRPQLIGRIQRAAADLTVRISAPADGSSTSASGCMTVNSGGRVDFTRPHLLQPTGIITFYDGDIVLGTAQVDQGSVVFTPSAPLPIGQHQIRAVYSGDAIYTASTSDAVAASVDRVKTITTISASSNTVRQGDSVDLVVTVSTMIDDVIKPAGAVTIREDGRILAVLDLDGAPSDATVDLSPGVHHYSASYAGNDDCQASASAAGKLTVLAPAVMHAAGPSGSVHRGQPVTLRASVKAAGSKTAPQGIVLFRALWRPAADTGRGATWVTLGQAQLSRGAAALQLKSLARGQYEIWASYNGDALTLSGQADPLNLLVV